MLSIARESSSQREKEESRSGRLISFFLCFGAESRHSLRIGGEKRTEEKRTEGRTIAIE